MRTMFFVLSLLLLVGSPVYAFEDCNGQQYLNQLEQRLECLQNNLNELNKNKIESGRAVNLKSQFSSSGANTCLENNTVGNVDLTPCAPGDRTGWIINPTGQ